MGRAMPAMMITITITTSISVKPVRRRGCRSSINLFIRFQFALGGRVIERLDVNVKHAPAVRLPRCPSRLGAKVRMQGDFQQSLNRVAGGTSHTNETAHVE